jgi:hypothetical protein
MTDSASRGADASSSTNDSLLRFAFVLDGMECFLEEHEPCHERDKEHEAGHQIWQNERIALEVLDVTKEAGVLLGRAGEEATKSRTKDGTDTPHERHEGEGFGLEFLFWHHLCYHGSNNTNIAIAASHDGTDGDGHWEAG